MESNTIRPEAIDLFGFIVGGFFLTVIAFVIALVVALVFCYLVSLCWRCRNGYPALNRAMLVAKVAAGATVATVVAAYVLQADGTVCPCHVATVSAGTIVLTLFYALITTPREIRSLRREREEWELRKARWQHHDQQHSLAG